MNVRDTRFKKFLTEIYSANELSKTQKRCVMNSRGKWKPKTVSIFALKWKFLENYGNVYDTRGRIYMGVLGGQIYLFFDIQARFNSVTFYKTFVAFNRFPSVEV